MNDLSRKVVEIFETVPSVLGITLGGSRGLGLSGSGSDYDFDVWCQGSIADANASLHSALRPFNPRILDLQEKKIFRCFYDGEYFDIFSNSVCNLENAIEKAESGVVEIDFSDIRSDVFPCRELSTDIISLLVNYTVIFDRDGYLRRLQERCMPMPEKLIENLVQLGMAGARHHLQKTERVYKLPEHIDYLIFCVSSFSWFLQIIVLSGYGRYPVLYKQSLQLVDARMKKVSKFSHKINRLYLLAAKSDVKSCTRLMQDLLESVVAEIQQIGPNDK